MRVVFRDDDFKNDSIAKCAYDLDIGPLNLFINIKREVVKRKIKKYALKSQFQINVLCKC
jgi:hypothetical protein